MIKQWLREPLVHFLLGGALLFAFFAFQDNEVDPASREIIVDKQVLTGISSGFEQQLGRVPTDAELDSLTERYVREEVLYREALRLGLDQDDAIIRRRLAQKMNLIAAAQADAAIPSDQTLSDWMKAHPARFAKDARYTFEQVWFSERGAADDAMKSGDPRETGGDNRGMIELPASPRQMPRSEIQDRFGQQFVRELDALEPAEKWQGPIPSGLGWHIVRLFEVQSSELPPLEAVRERVLADWRSSTAAQRQEEAYQLLRDAYTVDIDR